MAAASRCSAARRTRRRRRGRQTTRHPAPRCCSARRRPPGCHPCTAWATLRAPAPCPCRCPCQAEAARTHCSTTTACRTPSSTPCQPTSWTWAPRAAPAPVRRPPRLAPGTERGRVGRASGAAAPPGTERPASERAEPPVGVADGPRVWPSLGIFFFFPNKLVLRSFGDLGPGLEPGKGINYTPFLCSLSYLLSASLCLFSSLALSSSSFPFLLFSLSPFLAAFPFFTLSLFPFIFLACHFSLGFCFSVSL